jgi:hypothetical protein
MGDYRAAWQEYRRLRNLCLLTLLALAPIFWAVHAVSGKRLFVKIPVFVLLIFDVAALVAVSERIRKWSCPKCGYPFQFEGSETAFGWQGYNKGFYARKCASCGLRKYSD